MNKSTNTITKIPSKMYRIAGIRPFKGYYLVDTSDTKVERTDSPESFIKALEIARSDIAKGRLPRSYLETKRALPCGSFEPRIYWSNSTNSLSYCFNIASLKISEGNATVVTGEPSLDNKHYVEVLEIMIEERNYVNKEILIPALLKQYDERIKAFKDISLGKAVAITETKEKVNPLIRYAFKDSDHDIKVGDKKLIGITLPYGLSLYKTSGIRISNLKHNERVRFQDYPHPLYAFKDACERLLASHLRAGVGRFKHMPSINAKALPHGKSEKYITLTENVNTYSLRVAVVSYSLEFNYCRSFNFQGIGGIDNPDYMLKLGQAIRARDKAVNKLIELTYSDLRNTLRNINLKIEALEEVKSMKPEEQLPLTGTFEEGLSDNDLVELNEDMSSSFVEAMRWCKASPEAAEALRARHALNEAAKRTQAVMETRQEDKSVDEFTNRKDTLKRANPINLDTMTPSVTRTKKPVPDFDKMHYYLPETTSNGANVIVRAGSSGIIYQIDNTKQAKIEIYDVSASIMKLVSMTLVDLSLAKSHSITGNYNGKRHEINFSVNGRQLTLHGVTISDGLEFILTEE